LEERMAKEQLSKVDEFHRLSVSLDAAQLQHNTVLRRIEELKKELEENIIVNEIRGYRSSTIERNRKEIKELTDEAENLSVSIAAIQRQLPILKKEADIERFHESMVEMKTFSEKIISSVQSLVGGNIPLNELLSQLSSLSDEVKIFKSRLKDAFSAATRLNLSIDSIQEVEREFGESISLLLGELEDFSVKIKNEVFGLRYIFSR
jgi:DNA repair exonuclease SbcCD ATPase subunit